jgi:hypothetical protein
MNSTQYVVKTDGTYYLRVNDYRGEETDFDSTNAYTICVTLSANPDAPNEPTNDTKTNAIALTSGVAKQGYMATAGDVDWYKFTAYAGQILTFRESMAVSKVDLCSYIVSEFNDSVIWSLEDGNGEDGPTSMDSAQYVVKTDGTYFLRVNDYRGEETDFDSTNAYTICVTLSANPDAPNEPANDTKANAASLTSGVPKQGYLATGGDVDWYKFTAYAGNKITFSESIAISKVDLCVYIVNEVNDNVIWKLEDGNGSDAATNMTSTQNTFSADGTYYLKVCDYGGEAGDFDSVNPYTILVTLAN